MSRGGQALLDIQDITPFLNRPWSEFWHGADQQAAIDAIAKARAGEICTLQGYCPTLSGEPKWWDIKVSPIRGADGQVERLLCISRDITDRRRIENERRQTEERLRKSEEHLSAIFSQAAVGLSEISLDGCFQQVNDELCRIFQRSRQEMLALNVLDLTHSEDLSRSRMAVQQLVETGQPVSLDKRYLRPDGTIVWANSSLTRLDDDHGCPRTVLAVTVDLSDRKQAEENLRESEARYRAIVNQAITGVACSEIGGKFVLVNQKYCDITGYSAAELSQLRMYEITHPEDLPRNLELYNRMVAEGTPFEIEKRYIRKDGSIVWVNNSVSLVCDASGEPHSVVAIVLDITDRKRAEAERERLLANERQYASQQQGLTTAALAINSALSVEEVLRVIIDQAAAIVGTHQSVASMTIDQNWAQGINAIYLSDKYAQWQDYDQKPDGSGIYACVCHLNRPMRMTQAELEAHPRWRGFGPAADKHPPLRGWLAAPLVGRDGRNIGLIQLSDKFEGEFTEADESILVQLAQMASIAVENARLYEAEQQARSAAEASREEAQAANRVKDEFLAVLSHELRSPLNPILGWSKLLQSGKLDATKTAQALATIERNARLQSELIEDLLDVSRILRGKLSLNVGSVNLAATIRAAMETVRLAAEAKSIQVQASLPAISLVAGDSTRLQQVVWNLLSNAVKFTPEGGQVNIRLEHVGSCVHITVSDTGQGIAADFLPYVFDYFRQANPTTTRKFGGLGLGLAIVRHLVELHGGRIRAESAGEGEGATFIVQLPLMPTQSPVSQNARSPEPSLDLQALKILVVDDEPDTRELVTFVLEQQGAQVAQGSSAQEALIVLLQFQPDVLVSDIGMPEMDGYRLIQQVRTLAPEQGGQIPAIALTAYAGETNQQQVMAAGFQKHLSKPIDPEVLVQTILSLVRAT